MLNILCRFIRDWFGHRHHRHRHRHHHHHHHHHHHVFLLNSKRREYNILKYVRMRDE